MDSKDNIFEASSLKVHFPVKKGVFGRVSGYVKALDDVSFCIKRGETLGVVGESGSGKTTLARVVAGIVKPTSGSFKLYAPFGMVFQDPLGSLNPRRTIRATIEEVLKIKRVSAPAVELLEMVGLDRSALDKYPHEFSGGERQRICIARALASAPELLICDEAVSALDLSIRRQVLDLLSDLKRRLNLSMLFITHDLGVVQHIADRILVMHYGKIVESGECRRIIASPAHEYTRSLVSAVPKIGKPLE